MCEGYVFTGVCLSTGGCLPLVLGGCLPHTLPPPPLGRHPPPGQTPPGQTPLLGKHPHLGRPPPCPVHAGIQSTSGKYASHWNAFLLKTYFLLGRGVWCRAVVSAAKPPTKLWWKITPNYNSFFSFFNCKGWLIQRLLQIRSSLELGRFTIPFPGPTKNGDIRPFMKWVDSEGKLHENQHLPNQFRVCKIESTHLSPRIFYKWK